MQSTQPLKTSCSERKEEDHQGAQASLEWLATDDWRVEGVVPLAHYRQ
jgi:hypothetical protein